MFFYKVDSFFQEIVNRNQFKNIRFIIVQHCQKDLPFFLRALKNIGHIDALILKPSNKDRDIESYVKQYYSVYDLPKKILFQPCFTRTFLGSICQKNSSYIIFDIGGYFANALPVIVDDKSLPIIGIVEDTENGHQKYYQVLANNPQINIPIGSVARCRLKETEDYYVGLSIVTAVDMILRVEASTCINSLRTGVLGLGKVGKSITQNLTQRNVDTISYDLKALKRIQAKGTNLPVTLNQSKLLQSSQLLFSATGNKALSKKQFELLPNEAFVASCTSADDEMLLADLELISVEKQISKHIFSFTFSETKKKLYLLNRGNAVNFCNNQNIVIPYLFMVQAALIVLAKKIANSYKTTAEKFVILSECEEEEIATIWERYFSY